jgi:hypothetical protein
MRVREDRLIRYFCAIFPASRCGSNSPGGRLISPARNLITALRRSGADATRHRSHHSASRARIIAEAVRVLDEANWAGSTRPIRPAIVCSHGKLHLSLPRHRPGCSSVDHLGPRVLACGTGPPLAYLCGHRRDARAPRPRRRGAGSLTRKKPPRRARGLAVACSWGSGGDGSGRGF